MKKKLLTLVTLFLMLFVLSGCSSAKTIEQLTKPIDQVSARYGEPNPKIVKSVKTDTDGPTHKPMYVVFLKGNFKKGNLKAPNLEFSLLADGSYAWAITAFDDNNKDVWMDNE